MYSIPPLTYSDVSMLWAVSNNMIQTVKYHINNGVDVNEKANDRNESYLLIAIYRRHFEIVKLLVDAGAYINKNDNLCNDPLTVASAYDEPSIYNYLKFNQRIKG